MRLSVVIPTLNAAAGLPACLAALGREAPAGTEIVVADGGSTDGTRPLAAAAGARVIEAPPGRGPQLAAGAAAAGGAWLLFLHADTRLERGWRRPVAGFVDDPASQDRAAHFRFALDDDRRAARRLERVVAWRCRALGLPYGDQGLLIGRGLYERLGGFRPLPLMEDVDLVRRIGRQRIVALPVRAITSAARYRRDGYVVRTIRNTLCLSAFAAGVPPRTIARFYG